VARGRRFHSLCQKPVEGLFLMMNDELRMKEILRMTDERQNRETAAQELGNSIIKDGQK